MPRNAPPTLFRWALLVAVAFAWAYFSGSIWTQIGPSNRRSGESDTSSAMIRFDPNDTDLVPNTLAVLDPIVARAWDNRSVQILVLGVANEGSRLTENLDLAERRARAVADHLLARAVDERQIVVAATEAPAGDVLGPRCEVEIVMSRL